MREEKVTSQAERLHYSIGKHTSKESQVISKFPHRKERLMVLGASVLTLRFSVNLNENKEGKQND